MRNWTTEAAERRGAGLLESELGSKGAELKELRTQQSNTVPEGGMFTAGQEM
jgi:hypothetical protein